MLLFHALAGQSFAAVDRSTGAGEAQSAAVAAIRVRANRVPGQLLVVGVVHDRTNVRTLTPLPQEAPVRTVTVTVTTTQ